MARFAPGQSGNPEGARMHKAGKLRARLHEAAPEVIEKLITDAKAGDPDARRLFIERVLPALKSESDRNAITLPAGTLLDQANAVLAAATTGEIGIENAAELINAISKIVGVEQGTELKKRLDALEFGTLA